MLNFSEKNMLPGKWALKNEPDYREFRKYQENFYEAQIKFIHSFFGSGKPHLKDLLITDISNYIIYDLLSVNINGQQAIENINLDSIVNQYKNIPQKLQLSNMFRVALYELATYSNTHRNAGLTNINSLNEKFIETVRATFSRGISDYLLFQKLQYIQINA